MPHLYSEAEQRRQIQEQGLAVLTRNDCFTFMHPFVVYTSGKIAPYKVHCSNILRTPGDAHRASELLASVYYRMEHMAEHTLPATTTITGGESGDWLFSNTVAHILGLPAALLYKDARVGGAPLKDAVITHIADVNSEGSSMRDFWLPRIIAGEGRIKQTLFFVDLCTRGSEVMRMLHLPYDMVVSLNNGTWDVLRERGVINDEQHYIVRTYRDDSETWAQTTLRSDTGLRHLVQLLTSDSTVIQKRAVRVLTSGYPMLASELLEEMSEGRRALMTNEQQRHISAQIVATNKV